MGAALERAIQGQGYVFLGLAACTGAASCGLPRMSTRVELALLVGLIVLVGVPHGAVDPAYAAPSQRRAGWQTWAAFTARYLALAAAVLVLWLVWPAVALAGFLTLSVFHFSGDPAPGATMATRALQGAAVVVLPTLWHARETNALLAVLAGDSAAAWCLSVVRPLALPLVAALGVAAIVEVRRGRWLVAAEACAAAGVAIVAPPLLGFTIYFCGMHSARHLLRSAERAGLSWRRLALLGGLPMFGTVVVSLVALRLSAHVPMDVLAIRVVFIGLAALTVPHMLIVERARFAQPAG